MDSCRPDWSENFKLWIINLLSLSLESSVGVFEDVWYRQRRGVPTGGTPCVQIANITVYYILHKVVYSNPDLMRNIAAVKRYIDDGAGCFSGTKRQFTDWINRVNQAIAPYGLNIDESNIDDPGKPVAFLDIEFWFNSCGDLQTDLHVKETASRSYLYFGSSHPNHVFAGVVYSQCLRLRRIINDQTRLESQLNTLAGCFTACNYPERMVNNIVQKVKQMERRVDTTPVPPTPGSPDNPKIRVISTYGADSELLDIVEKYSSSLSLTSSFSTSTSATSTSNLTEPSDSASSTKPPNPIFSLVKRTGSSLRRKLVRAKSLALGNNGGKTKPCNKPKCACCPIISDSLQFNCNGTRVNPAGGTCTSNNVIYCIVCTGCSKPYVGRTTQQLRSRISAHRSGFYKVLDVSRSDNFTPNDLEVLADDSDSYTLGLHLYNMHGCKSADKFKEYYRVFILDQSSPKSIEVKEHKFIHLLKSLQPSGLNKSNPFNIPLLPNG